MVHVVAGSGGLAWFTLAWPAPAVITGFQTTYAYDGADRPTALTTAQGGATTGQFGYSYSRAGQATQASEGWGAPAAR